MKDRNEARRELCASGKGETGACVRARLPAALASNAGMNTKCLHALSWDGFGQWIALTMATHQLEL